MKAAAQAVTDTPEAAAEAALNPRQRARRKRIIAAALELASRGGYDAVQMRDVAARADVALGTLYRYFPSKDLLLAHTWADWSHEIERYLHRYPLRGKTAADRIMDFIRRSTQALEREPTLAGALVKSLLVPEPSAEEARAELSEVMFRVVDDQLRDLAPEDRSGIRIILGHVWYANLLLWVNGRTPVEQVYENMATACRLLLEHRNV